MNNALFSLLPIDVYLEINFRWFRFTNPKAFALRQRMRREVTNEGYSYRPFDEKQAIFVHIPKCAGVSLNKAIFGNLAGGHSTLDDYLTIYEPRRIRKYFKFTIVRNPWDRLVSAFFFLKEGGFSAQDKSWFEQELREYEDFGQFVRRWLNKRNIWKWHHFKPQYHYMTEKHGRVEMDFIGYLENIEEDFSYIAKRLGVVCSMPSSNKSKHNSYIDYYDDETKAIVAEVYAEDIKVLGYNFDNSSLPLQLGKRKLSK